MSGSTISAHLPRPAVLAGFVAGYAVAVLLAEHTYGSVSVPSPFWLPDSVLLCALLLAPRSQWWVFAFAIWPVRIFVGAVPGTPVWFQFVSLANDTAKGLAAAWLLARFVRRPIHLKTLHELMLFLGIAAAAIPAASALIAAPARYVLGDPFWRAAQGWFLGNAVTQVVVTPMLVYWGRRDFRERVDVIEATCAACGLAGALIVGFLVDHSSAALMFMYLPIPFLVWVAVRLGPFGAANALALVAAVTMLAAVRGSTVFAGEPPAGTVLTIQLFLLVVGLSMLSLAIVVAEREALQAREATWNRRLIDAQEHERSRIASELHDDIGQQVALLLIEINQFAKGAEISERAREELRTLCKAGTRISSDLTGISHNLHPLVVDLVGFEAAVRGLCQRFTERRSLAVQLHCDGVPAEVPHAVSLCSYRLVQEALHNVVKHSSASRAGVELLAADGWLTVCVSDAGSGFDPAHAIGGGLGLISMRERVRSVGGHFTIETAPGSGTRLRALLPLPRHAGDNTASRDDLRHVARNLSVSSE